MACAAVTAQHPDHELHQLADELRSRNHVVVGWHARLGGGIICGATVTVRMPGEQDFRATSDAEIAVLRALEIQGALSISWPFRPGIACIRDEPHAPLDERLEAAARALAAQRS